MIYFLLFSAALNFTDKGPASSFVPTQSPFLQCHVLTEYFEAPNAPSTPESTAMLMFDIICRCPVTRKVPHVGHHRRLKGVSLGFEQNEREWFP